MHKPYHLLAQWADLDPDKVALSPPTGVDGAWLARQLKGRRTAKSKIPAWYHLPEIEYPPTANLGQASSEATARYKAKLLAGKAVADLCGGAGVDAWFIRALATAYLFNEPDADLLTLAKHNLALGQGPEVAFYGQGAEEFTASDLAPYNALYLDPSRRQAGGSRAWNWATMQPDLTQMPWLWQWPGMILIKLSPAQDFTEVERHLPPVHCWHVLSVGNEVKELLAEVYPLQTPAHHGLRNVVELETEAAYTYNPSASGMGKFSLQPVEVGHFLHEPTAGLLKAGAQDAHAASVRATYKLHANTHLYGAAAPLPGWLGKVYRVAAQLPIDAKHLQTLGGVQISARNFGLEPDAIRKKYKLKAGDAAHLFFVQDVKGYSALRVERCNS